VKEDIIPVNNMPTEMTKMMPESLRLGVSNLPTKIYKEMSENKHK